MCVGMDENVGTMLAQVARLMRRAFDAKARQIGVTRPQWQVLGTLSRNPGINQGALAELLEVEPITAGRMIDRMQDAELVERRPDPADRRAWRLHLTQRGARLFADLQPYAMDAVEAALDGIDAGERAQMMRVLARMRANLTGRPAMAVAANG